MAVDLHLIGFEAENARDLLDEQIELTLEVAYLADVLVLVFLELLVLFLLQLRYWLHSFHEHLGMQGL